MGQVLAVISGKGGTGKTTLCAAVASCLAAEGQRVLCIDADIGLRNLDIALGMAELSIISFTDVLHANYDLSQATAHPQIPNLQLLTAPIRENAELISQEAFGDLLQQVRQQFDWCLIDAAAGIGAGFRLATRFADQIMVVSTPDPASLRDAACAADLLALDSINNLRLVVNRVDPKMFSRMELTVDDVMDGVGLPLLGIVPEDANVVLAAAHNMPLILQSGKGASIACLHIARRLCGKRMPLMKL
jgi:septum site-determining protein MinD